MKFFSFLTQEIAIDLGTANTLIIWNDKVVVDEPSIVAKDIQTGKVVAIGRKAQQMHGKTHKLIETVRPLKDGVIADFKLAEAMIRHFVGLVCKVNFFIKPTIIICVPSTATSVERRAIQDAADRDTDAAGAAPPPPFFHRARVLPAEWVSWQGRPP